MVVDAKDHQAKRFDERYGFLALPDSAERLFLALEEDLTHPHPIAIGETSYRHSALRRLRGYPEQNVLKSLKS
jgi:hypothetical protein